MRTGRLHLGAALLLAASVAWAALAQNAAETQPRDNRKGAKGEVKMPTPAFRTEVPVRSHDLIL